MDVGPGLQWNDAVLLAGDRGADVEDVEDKYYRDHQERVEMVNGYWDDFWAYMSVMGHKRIFDDPGEVPLSVAFVRRFRDLDDGVFDVDGEDPILAMALYNLSKSPASYAEAMRRSTTDGDQGMKLVNSIPVFLARS